MSPLSGVAIEANLTVNSTARGPMSAPSIARGSDPVARRALVPAAATTTADSRRPVSLPAVLGSLVLGAVAAVAVAEPSAAVFGIRAAALVSGLVATGLGVLLVTQPATEESGMSVVARRCAAVSVLAVATGFAAVAAQIVDVGGSGWSGLLSSSSRADVLTSGVY